ncbi:hypothetical protein D3C81_1661880 [compost metagenome]
MSFGQLRFGNSQYIGLFVGQCKIVFNEQLLHTFHQGSKHCRFDVRFDNRFVFCYEFSREVFHVGSQFGISFLFNQNFVFFRFFIQESNVSFCFSFKISDLFSQSNFYLCSGVSCNSRFENFDKAVNSISGSANLFKQRLHFCGV